MKQPYRFHEIVGAISHTVLETYNTRIQFVLFYFNSTYFYIFQFAISAQLQETNYIF